MARCIVIGAAVAVILFAVVEWLLWQAGRRWYVEPPFPSHACDGCDREEWEAQNAGA